MRNLIHHFNKSFLLDYNLLYNKNIHNSNYSNLPQILVAQCVFCGEESLKLIFLINFV